MELQTVFLPGKRVVGAAIVSQTVGTLSVVGHKTVVVADRADDDAVVGAKDDVDLTLPLCAQDDVLGGTVVVAGGLQMAYAADYRRLDLAEMTGIAEDSRELTGQGMERRVEDQTADVVATDVALAFTGRQEDTKRDK